VANTQDGINLQAHTRHTSFTKASVLVDKHTLAKQHASSEIRVNEHSDVNKQSEPAKHIRKHPNHKFTCEVLTTAHSWLKRRIKEAFYIARFRPELNKQVQSLDLTLFPMGTGST